MVIALEKAIRVTEFLIQSIVSRLRFNSAFMSLEFLMIT